MLFDMYNVAAKIISEILLALHRNTLKITSPFIDIVRFEVIVL
jgi:hypothetical protein